MPWGISHKNQWIFVHIPKTAGVSICSSWDGALLKEHCKKNGVLGGGHKTIWEIWDKYPETKSYFIWTVTRNPFDRFVSAWFFPKEGTQPNRDPESSDFSTSLLKPQTEWVNFDKTFFVRFENLKIDLSCLFLRLGLGNIDKIPHFRQSNRGHYKDYISEKLRAIIEDHYRNDFNLLGYAW